VLEVPRAEWVTPDAGDWILQEVHDDCLRRQEPCTRGEADEVLTVAIRLMRCEPPDEFIRAGYINIMTMFPAELLLPSVKAAIAAERYHVLPTVGAFCHQARIEHELRQQKIGQLRRAISRLELRKFYEDKAGTRSRASRVQGSQPKE
jgi:hypothetical protein